MSGPNIRWRYAKLPFKITVESPIDEVDNSGYKFEETPFEIIDGPVELVLRNPFFDTDNVYLSGTMTDSVSHKLIPKWNCFRENALVFKNYEQAHQVATKYRLEIEKLRYKL